MKPSLLLLITWLTMNLTAQTPDRIITYKKIGDVELRLHIFNPPNHQASDKAPAIVFFFGGGWIKGSPEQFFPFCKHLASRGMVAASAEYRIQSKHGTTPVECVKDGKSALRWMRTHAEKLGIDPHKLAAGGGSAGGHVAAVAGNVVGFEEEGEDLSIASKPDALVLMNPVFDNGPEGYGHNQVEAFWEAFSPLHNITGGAPPTVVFLGTQDKLIPVATAETYKAQMEAVGSRCDLYLHKDQPHGFFNARFKENYEKILPQMDAFLRSLAYIKSEE
ncbi:alpha/beta hydrolase [Kiritimatiellaeota bacterium B1221]|nr:alpha/beta hydrolase [Kiritimatiellaeota bacterium B1221]